MWAGCLTELGFANTMLCWDRWAEVKLPIIGLTGLVIGLAGRLVGLAGLVGSFPSGWLEVNCRC